ncbi:hypothetical protein IKF15_03820 [Candidatus Saccharibacteria bacterium]|nr:hypothetical protein [Candidatus Saccharibacteria bacterium]
MDNKNQKNPLEGAMNLFEKATSKLPPFPPIGGSANQPTTSSQSPTQPQSTASGQSSTIVQPNFVNVQTQSLVPSSREVAEKELQEISAYNAQRQHEQQIIARNAKTKRLLTLMLIIIFAVIFGIVAIWMIFNVFLASRKTANVNNNPTAQSQAALGKIGTYKCKTGHCEKIVDLPNQHLLIRDTNYYEYDPETKAVTLTTIDSLDYHTITPFLWHDKVYLILDPESDQSALYNLSDNRILTSYNYDNFLTDPNDVAYKSMSEQTTRYIIAKTSNAYRLIDLSSGEELISGSGGLFVYGDYFFEYDTNGERRVYGKNRNRILVAQPGSGLYVKNGYLVYVRDAKSSPLLYDNEGKNASDSTLSREFSDISKNGEYISGLNARSDYYTIPVDRK